MRYVGRTPDADASVAPKSYADATAATSAVTTSVVNTRIASAAALLTSASYADTQDALRAHKAEVLAADELYFPTTALGATNGVASIDSDGFVPTAQLPQLLTDRVATCYSVVSPTAGLWGATTAGTSGAVGSISFTTTLTATSTSPREQQLASIPVPDPGYPWRPLPFAWVMGKGGGTAPATRKVGTGNYGMLSVMPPSGVSNVIYGLGLCSASSVNDVYPVLPFAQTNQTPTNVPPVTGALTLNLYGACWSGTNYVYSAANLVYFVLVVPALGGGA